MKPRITILRRTELVEQIADLPRDRRERMRQDRSGHFFVWSEEEKANVGGDSTLHSERTDHGAT